MLIVTYLDGTTDEFEKATWEQAAAFADVEKIIVKIEDSNYIKSWPIQEN